MRDPLPPVVDRRVFLTTSLGCAAWAACPFLHGASPAAAQAPDEGPPVRAVVRDAVLFAGIRKPITTRAELEPRIAQVTRACAGKIDGPLTHIFRFDTPVEGYDSEIGYPVTGEVDDGEVRTHRLRRLHFFAAMHEGPIETLRQTSARVSAHMLERGLSSELELVEVYHHRDADRPAANRTEVMQAFLAWPEVYREQLTRVLGPEAAAEVWRGGEAITPDTLVDARAAWVAASVARLKARTDARQQFDILSRVALVRPTEDVAQFQAIYAQTGRVEDVFHALGERLARTPTGSFVDPPRFDGKILHLSKVARDRKAYDAARTPEETRRAYCFCSLVRAAADPQIDPIFCYRAAGWDRQLWEPVLGRTFTSCRITHSILKGDRFCAWDYDV
jgi:effector-binding domain-containing protein